MDVRNGTSFYGEDVLAIPNKGMNEIIFIRINNIVTSISYNINIDKKRI